MSSNLNDSLAALAALPANPLSPMSHLRVCSVWKPQLSSLWVRTQVWNQSNPREHVGGLKKATLLEMDGDAGPELGWHSLLQLKP